MLSWLPWRKYWSISIFRPSGEKAAWSSLGMMGILMMLVFVWEQGWTLRTPREWVTHSLKPGLQVVFTGLQTEQWVRLRLQLQSVLAQRVLDREKELAQVVVDQQELQRLREENELLRGLNRDHSFRRVVADWWGVPRSWWINVGCEQGIRTGNIVVSEGILVGEVTQVLPNVSAVRALDDPDWEFPVRVGTSSAVGVFSLARGVAEVREVAQTSPVAVGEVVVTPGRAEQPAAVPVARVTNRNETQGFGTWELQVEPLKQPTQLRFVEVLLDTAKEATCLLP